MVGEAGESDCDRVGDYFIILGEEGSNFHVALSGYTWRVQLMNSTVLLAAG